MKPSKYDFCIGLVVFNNSFLTALLYGFGESKKHPNYSREKAVSSASLEV
jgi:hypothetical protein